MNMRKAAVIWRVFDVSYSVSHKFEIMQVIKTGKVDFQKISKYYDTFNYLGAISSHTVLQYVN